MFKFLRRRSRTVSPGQSRPAATGSMPIPDQQDVVTVAPATGRRLEVNPAAESPLLNPEGPK
jgi:hypothetical protein